MIYALVRPCKPLLIWGLYAIRRPLPLLIMVFCHSFPRSLPIWESCCIGRWYIANSTQIGNILPFPCNVSPNWEALYTIIEIGDDEPRASTTWISLPTLPETGSCLGMWTQQRKEGRGTGPMAWWSITKAGL
jgi:hypothetical protein